jgi:hypothetical protein
MKRIIGVAILSITFLLGCAGVFLAATGGDVDVPRTELSTPSTIPAPSGKPPAPPTAIKGDDLVQVGEDVPAGTYRAVAEVGEGDLCYWLKSADAEGEKIIDNGVPTGGRPQVTLKKGEWFTSQGCPEWRRK